MPELPDVVVYTERIAALFGGRPLRALRIANPFLLRSVGLAASAFAGKRLRATRRMGKRVVLEFEDEHFAVVHLMIAGRFHLRDPGAKPNRNLLCDFDFETQSLTLTEAGTKRRASLHLVQGEQALSAFDRGGLEPLSSSLAEFSERLQRENHTLKRSLTDPELFSGIGNAYSDEILHRAGLSPVQRSRALGAEQTAKLHEATRTVLTEWTELLRKDTGDGFPEKVTAFRPEMAVHGRYGQPCPVCGTKVQRIVHASNEVNYCPQCQTEGKLLRDRSLSRLLHADWPKTLEELEERRVALALPSQVNTKVENVEPLPAKGSAKRAGVAPTRAEQPSTPKPRKKRS
jgi:formamidopyrimidine-DNA glycosylase